MKDKILLVIFVIIDLILLADSASLSFTFVTITTMVINVYSFLTFMLKHRKNNIVCFELFFSFAFFLVLYTYYFYDKSAVGWMGSQILLNIHGDISFVKGTIISSIGYLLFILGAIFADCGDKGRRPARNYAFSRNKEIISLVVFLFVFIMFMNYSFSSYMIAKRAEVTLDDGWTQWLNLSLLFYSLIVFMNSRERGISKWNNFIFHNKVYVILLLVILVIHFISGHRHHFMTIALSVFFLYSLCVKRVSSRYVVCGIIVFYLFFSIIGIIRSGEVGLNEYEMNTVSMLRDFFPGSVATPFFIEYADNNGITYGSNYFYQITAIVPFLSGFLVRSGFFVAGPSSYDFFTEYVQNGEVTSGLGTSLVGDVYYSFGFWGVFILFPLLGYFVSWLYKRIFVIKSTSAYETVAYTVLMGLSLFLPRADFFSGLRFIALSCIFYYLIHHFAPRK